MNRRTLIAQVSAGIPILALLSIAVDRPVHARAPAVAAAPRAVAEAGAQEIVRRSAEVQAADFQALPQFNYFQTARNPDGTSRTWERLMLFGSRYSRLVAENGMPLPADRQAAEEARLQRQTSERGQESPSKRAVRVNTYEQERQRDNLLLQEMPRAFDFTLVGEDRLQGHEVYVLKATPRRGYRPPSNRARVLTGMEGTLYIEKATFHWVKVQARVIHPVSIEGFIARVNVGTRFELEQMPVSTGIWLPSRFAMTVKTRILLLFSRRTDEDEIYYGYYAISR
jgi:hypothetical protein